MVVRVLSLRSTKVPCNIRFLGFLKKKSACVFHYGLYGGTFVLVFGRNKGREEAESEAASSLGCGYALACCFAGSLLDSEKFLLFLQFLPCVEKPESS